MKILELSLKAYGPFTETTLDLSAGDAGLHVVEGPNEAGKSSALRAIEALLFGFPARTPDIFSHPYEKLRVGATLAHEDGTVLSFVRRKGNKRTLRNADDTADLPDDALAKFLGEVGREQFRSMFGIDHEELARNSSATLATGGQLGQLLFGTGLDLANLRTFQRRLIAEAGELFLSKGKNQTINRAIAELADARAAIEAVSLRGTDWVAAQAELEGSRARKTQIDERLIALGRERARLDRLEKAIPEFARRRTLLSELDSLAGTPRLRADFPAERQQAQADLRHARESLSKAEAERASLLQELGAVEVPSAILDREEAIAALQKRAGVYASSQGESLKLSVELETHQARVRMLARELGLADASPDQLAAFRLRVDQKSRIQNLGENGLALRFELDGCLRELAKHEKAAGEAALKLERMEDACDVAPIKRSIARLRRLGDLEAQRAEAVALCQSLRGAVEAAWKRLPLRVGDLASIESLAVPSEQTIDRFARDLDELTQNLWALRDRESDLDTELQELGRRIEQQRLEGDVPSEGELDTERTRRDAYWATLKDFLAGANAGDPPRTGREIEGFEVSKERCDDLADRLRREAARVAERAKLLADVKHGRERQSVLTKSENDARTRLARVEADWQALWEAIAIDPLPPWEMLAWRRQHAELVEETAKIRAQEAIVAGLDARLFQARQEIGRIVSEIGQPIDTEATSLDVLLETCEEAVEAIAQSSDRRKATVRDLEKARRDLDDAKGRAEALRVQIDEWKTAWGRAVAQLGLDAEASPKEAADVRALSEELAQTHDQAESIDRRLRGLELERTLFERDARDLFREIAPDLDDQPVLLAVDRCAALLGEARTLRTRHADLQARRVALDRECLDAQASIASRREQLANLCREAGCDNMDGLPDAEERSERLRTLISERDEVEARLLRLGGGTSLEDFLRQAESLDFDEIVPRMNALDGEIEELSRQKEGLDQAIGGLVEKLRRMDEQSRDAKAIEASARKQHLIARIETDVERYSRLKLAAAVLRTAIDRYREKNQAPVLDRAGALFRLLTRGSFEALRPELDDDKEPRLVGIRSGTKSEVPVAGMSEGTVDQLYLALKLAVIEHHLDSHPPIPFIVDDILVHFDDDRAIAALQALAMLSSRTQVLFFTHHRHLVDLATKHLDPRTIFVHRLEPGRSLAS